MSRKKIALAGSVFSRLTVLSESDPVAGRRRVLCICDCGSKTVVDPRLLNSGKTKSCGCLQKEKVSIKCTENNRTHGMSRTKEYNTWTHLKGRCNNPENPKYPIYGARGIKVCPSWVNSFESFFNDMGVAPTKFHSIERIDVNGHYEANNCKWATNQEQSLNKRSNRMVNFNGEQMPLAEACRRAGVNYRSALYRINNGLHWMSLPPKPTGGVK